MKQTRLSVCVHMEEEDNAVCTAIAGEPVLRTALGVPRQTVPCANVFDYDEARHTTSSSGAFSNLFYAKLSELKTTRLYLQSLDSDNNACVTRTLITLFTKSQASTSNAIEREPARGTAQLKSREEPTCCKTATAQAGAPVARSQNSMSGRRPRERTRGPKRTVSLAYPSEVSPKARQQLLNRSLVSDQRASVPPPRQRRLLHCLLESQSGLSLSRDNSVERN
ncbi:hypothetical protein HPB50_023649 [Hyalomma asiaticum]|uniref:Uncharacterized protein n=1 Tax=Hyalomma asiaticum TaxID=266040 RepID=A0ACB7T4H2_HYAAI|nr:hypothetical protein HPB50_023649 [Hyalomma asiaticum]